MVLLLVLKLIGVVVSYASGNAVASLTGVVPGCNARRSGGKRSAQLIPGVCGYGGSLRVMGMGTTFAGIVRAPMTSVVMIFETTETIP